MDKFTPRDELAGGALVERVGRPTLIGRRVATRDETGGLVFAGARNEELRVALYNASTYTVVDTLITLPNTDAADAIITSIRAALGAWTPFVNVADGRLIVRIDAEEIASISIVPGSPAAPALGLFVSPHPLAMSAAGDYTNVPTSRGGEDGIGAYIVPFEDRTSASINRAVDAVARNTVDIDTRLRRPVRVRAAVACQVTALPANPAVAEFLNIRTAPPNTQLCVVTPGQSAWVASDPATLRRSSVVQRAFIGAQYAQRVLGALANPAKTDAMVCAAYISARESAELNVVSLQSRAIYGVVDSDGRDIVPHTRLTAGGHELGDAVFIRTHAGSPSIDATLGTDISPLGGPSVRTAQFAGTALAPAVRVDGARVITGTVVSPHEIRISYQGAFEEHGFIEQLAIGGELVALTTQGVFRARAVREDGLLRVEPWAGDINDFLLVHTTSVTANGVSYPPARDIVGQTQQLSEGAVQLMLLVGRFTPATSGYAPMFHVAELPVGHATVQLVLDNAAETTRRDAAQHVLDWERRALRSAVGEFALAPVSLSALYTQPSRVSYTRFESGPGATSRISLVPRLNPELASYTIRGGWRTGERAIEFLSLAAPGRHLANFLERGQIDAAYAAPLALAISRYTGSTLWARQYDPTRLYHPDDADVVLPGTLRGFYAQLLAVAPMSEVVSDAVVEGRSQRTCVFNIPRETAVSLVDPRDAGRQFRLFFGPLVYTARLLSVRQGVDVDRVVFLVDATLPPAGAVARVVPSIGYCVGDPGAIMVVAAARSLSATTTYADTRGAVATSIYRERDPRSADTSRVAELSTVATGLRGLTSVVNVSADRSSVDVVITALPVGAHIVDDAPTLGEIGQVLDQPIEHAVYPLSNTASAREIVRALAALGQIAESTMSTSAFRRLAAAYAMSGVVSTAAALPPDVLAALRSDALNILSDADDAAVQRANRALAVTHGTRAALLTAHSYDTDTRRVIDIAELDQILTATHDTDTPEIVAATVRLARDLMARGATLRRGATTLSSRANDVQINAFFAESASDFTVELSAQGAPLLCSATNMLLAGVAVAGAAGSNSALGFEGAELMRSDDATVLQTVAVSAHVRALAASARLEVGTSVMLPVVAHTPDPGVAAVLAEIPSGAVVSISSGTTFPGVVFKYGAFPAIGVDAIDHTFEDKGAFVGAAATATLFHVRVLVGSELRDGVLLLIIAAAPLSNVPALPALRMTLSGSLVGSDEDIHAFARYSGRPLLASATSVDVVSHLSTDDQALDAVPTDVSLRTVVHSDVQTAEQRSDGVAYVLSPSTASPGSRRSAVAMTNEGAALSAALRLDVASSRTYESSAALTVSAQSGLLDENPTSDQLVLAQGGAALGGSDRARFVRSHSAGAIFTGTGPLLAIGATSENISTTISPLIGQLNCGFGVLPTQLWAAAGRVQAANTIDNALPLSVATNETAVVASRGEQMRVAAFINGVVATQGVLSLCGDAAGGRGWYHNMGQGVAIAGVQGHANPIIAPRSSFMYSLVAGVHLQQSDVYGMMAELSDSPFSTTGGGPLSDGQQLSHLATPTLVPNARSWLPEQPQQLGERVVILRQDDALDDGAGSLSLRSDVPFTTETVLGYVSRSGQKRSGLLRVAYVKASGSSSDALVLYYAREYFNYGASMVGRTVVTQLSVTRPVSSGGNIIVGPGVDPSVRETHTSPMLTGVISAINHETNTTRVVITPAGRFRTFAELDPLMPAGAAPLPTTPALQPALLINPYRALGFRPTGALDFASCAAPGADNFLGGDVDAQCRLVVHGREWIINAFRASVSDTLSLVNDIGQVGGSISAAPSQFGETTPDLRVTTGGAVQITAPDGVFVNDVRIDQTLRVATAGLSVMLRVPMVPGLGSRQITSAEQARLNALITSSDVGNPSALLPCVTAAFAHTPLETPTYDAPAFAIETHRPLPQKTTAPRAVPFFAYIPLILDRPESVGGNFDPFDVDMWVHGRVRIRVRDGVTVDGLENREIYGAVVGRIEMTWHNAVQTGITDGLFLAPVFMDFVAESTVTGEGDVDRFLILDRWAATPAHIEAALTITLTNAPLGVRLLPTRSTFLPETYDWTSATDRDFPPYIEPNDPDGDYRDRRTYIEQPTTTSFSGGLGITANPVYNYLPSSTMEHYDDVTGLDHIAALPEFETYRAGRIDGAGVPLDDAQQRDIVSGVFGWWSLRKSLSDSAVHDYPPTYINSPSHPANVHQAAEATITRDTSATEGLSTLADNPRRTLRVWLLQRNRTPEQLRDDMTIDVEDCHGALITRQERTALHIDRLHDGDGAGRGFAPTRFLQRSTAYTEQEIEDLAEFIEQQNWVMSFGSPQRFRVESITVSPHALFGLDAVNDGGMPKHGVEAPNRVDVYEHTPTIALIVGNTLSTRPAFLPSLLSVYTQPMSARGFVARGAGSAPTTDLTNAIAPNVDEFFQFPPQPSPLSPVKHPFLVRVDRDKLRAVIEAATISGKTHTLSFSVVVHYTQLS
jgi:hypothetical protein